MTEDTNKRGKVTDEHRQEAARLRSLWDRRNAERRDAGQPRLTQEAFGAEFGIGNQAAVGFFLNGKTALSIKAAAGFARGLGCRIGDFSPRLAALVDAAVPPAVASPASGVAQQQAMRLGVEFSNLPDKFQDGTTRAQLFEQMLAMIQAKRQAPPPTSAPRQLQTEGR